MRKKYIIKLPEVRITPQEIESRIKRHLKEYKDGVLAKVLVFTYLYQPVSATELTKKLKNYYYQEFDRATIYRYLVALTERGLLGTTTAGYAMSLEKNNEILNEVKKKYMDFVQNIPDQFRIKFQNVKYFFVNDYGEKFVPWCCEIIGFKYSERKDGEDRD